MHMHVEEGPVWGEAQWQMPPGQRGDFQTLMSTGHTAGEGLSGCLQQSGVDPQTLAGQHTPL